MKNLHCFFVVQQIPQQQEIHVQHSIEAGQTHSIEIPGPSSTVSQAVTGRNSYYNLFNGLILKIKAEDQQQE